MPKDQGLLNLNRQNNQSFTHSILKETPILILHGEQDEVIPIKSFYKSVKYLSANKCNLESHALPTDAHNISPSYVMWTRYQSSSRL